VQSLAIEDAVKTERRSPTVAREGEPANSHRHLRSPRMRGGLDKANARLDGHVEQRSPKLQAAARAPGE
jgi:hypothetical protein